jgi:hypothetical protein
MLALEMDKSEVKIFMGKLIRENVFDDFETRSVEVFAAIKFSIDGMKETGFAAWSEIRPLVYEVMKLCAKPRQIKIIFSHKNFTEIHTNAAALFLNLLYENDSVTFTTACAQKEFALDKSLDAAWDDWVRNFFAKTGFSITDRE